MYRANSIYSSLTLKDKISNFDYILLLSILLLGVISIFTQYSSSGGVFDYHSKSHAIRFILFFFLFLTISLISINFWFCSSFLIYFFFLLLLFVVEYFGITSSGSRRWINIYIFNRNRYVVIRYFWI